MHSGSIDPPRARFEYVSCNLCRDDQTEPYHRERLRYFDEIIDLQVVRCRCCGLVYTNPRIVDANDLYIRGGVGELDAIEHHARAKANVFARAIEEIERFCPTQRDGNPTRLLDIGCGTGHFLDAAQRRGFSVCGIEPAPLSAAYARGCFGVHVAESDVLETEFDHATFDVITAWDVIEHVPDPRAVIQRCTNWLKPGGIMALRFPSAPWQKLKGIVFQQLLRSNRAAFGATMHLTFFTEQTFRQMAQEEGLVVLRSRTTLAEANTHNFVLDGLKLASNVLAQTVEKVSGRHLGNLEVYCRRVSE